MSLESPRQILFIKELTSFFSKNKLVIKATKTKKRKIIRQLILNALLNCIRTKYFDMPVKTFEDEFESLNVSYFKTLRRVFTRHPEYVNVSKNKKKKILRRLILNALLNCIRVLKLNKPAISFEKEFGYNDVNTKKEYIPDIRDQCWSTKKILYDLKYDVFVSQNDLAIDIQKIKQELRKNSDINYTHLEEGVTATVNDVYNKERLNYNTLLEQVIFEIEKREKKTKQSEATPPTIINFPTEIDAFLFNKLLTAIKGDTDINPDIYSQLGIVRFILNKYNKHTMPDIDKKLIDYIPADLNKTKLKKYNSTIKKRLNELIS
jgi:hypothetical protein